MITYESFIGIDIGKYSFFVVLHGNKKVYEYENTPAGINEFIKFHRKTLKKGLCILETTGGYEMGVLLRLCSEGFAVHRANTRKVKHFIKSYGNAAKTDKLDAKNLVLSSGLDRTPKSHWIGIEIFVLSKARWVKTHDYCIRGRK